MRGEPVANDLLVEAGKPAGAARGVEGGIPVPAAVGGENLVTERQDAVFIGPSDLAASMGLLGQQDHPDVVETVERCIRAVTALGKPVGVNAFAEPLARRYLAAGADFILVGADVAMLARGSEQLAARFIPAAPDAAPASY